MKVKVISRNPDMYLRGTKTEIHKIPRNFDPKIHHFQAAREYVKALNAVKLERVFAKPFLGNLDGHRDAISCISTHPDRLSSIISGAYDGEVKIWDVPQKRCIRELVAHEGTIRGITYTSNSEHFITLGDDKTIKTWKSLTPQFGEEDIPVNTMLSKTMLAGITHNRKEGIFATCGEICQIWEENRNEPIKTFQWGVDTIHHAAFNPIEYHLLASCASDRSIILYDTRESGPLRKVVMKLRSNRLCWNPMEAFVFTVANEDYNLYSFDMRSLKTPTNVHKDHVGAVTDLDYSPTGKEFVSGSYDKTVRIFEGGKGHSREVYHTKRMQRLTCVRWSLDNKYIFSGSDEMNVRIWKARASEKLGPLKPRERAALNYSEALKDKFAAHPKIRRIQKHRQVPKHIYNARAELRVIREKEQRKDANRRSHSKKGTVPYIPERQKHIIKEDV